MHFTHHNTVQPLPQIKAKLTKLITDCGKMRRIVNKIESTCTIIYQLFWRSFYTFKEKNTQKYAGFYEFLWNFLLRLFLETNILYTCFTLILRLFDLSQFVVDLKYYVCDEDDLCFYSELVGYACSSISTRRMF